MESVILPVQKKGDKADCSNTSIYQPTDAHIISHKTLLKYFKTFRNVSILSDHHQGTLFLAKVMLQCSEFNSYL
jgi:NADPH-dependent 7-cyano-7-deazaguanine reductase QueF